MRAWFSRGRCTPTVSASASRAAHVGAEAPRWGRRRCERTLERARLPRLEPVADPDRRYDARRRAVGLRFVEVAGEVEHTRRSLGPVTRAGLAGRRGSLTYLLDAVVARAETDTGDVAPRRAPRVHQRARHANRHSSTETSSPSSGACCSSSPVRRCGGRPCRPFPTLPRSDRAAVRSPRRLPARRPADRFGRCRCRCPRSTRRRSSPC
jgi:hypothetical protein